MRRITGSAGSRVGNNAVPALVLTALLSPLSQGCGGSHGNVQPTGTSGIEMRAAEDHPRLSLVARQGDPFAGLAVAIAHDFGGNASLWLGALITRRVERALGHEAPLRPTAGGFVISAPIGTADEAARYVRAVNDALSRPFGAEEIAQAERTRQSGPTLRIWASAAEAAVASCDGELGDRTRPVTPRPADLEQWRLAVRSAESVAFAAVGPRAVLEATASALHATPPWPSRQTLTDPWPEADVVGGSPSASNGHTLSIALRVADGERVLAAAASLGNPRSAAAAHLAALDHPWNIDRVVGTLRPRGACLRFDLSSSDPDPASASLAASTAALMLDEAERALAGTRNEIGSLDSAVLGQGDPREAASTAAWHALHAQLPAGPPRTLVSFAPAAGTNQGEATAAFQRLLPDARAARKKTSVEVRREAEAGQGEVWMLLASPCATYRETGADAGVNALTMRALATALPEMDGIRFEPWISSDGIGLLAHGPRQSASETTLHHATRVASALGRALAVSPLPDAVTVSARVRLSAELSPELDPLWPVALEALSPKHPSLLDPRGTWQSITETSAHSVETARRSFVRGPLRLAVLSPEVAPRAEAELERWLRPERTEKTSCPASPALPPRPGEYALPSGAPGPASRAILAVAIPSSSGGGVPLEAAATAQLLNRPGGWLSTSLRVPGLAVFAEASVLGGGDRAALAVEITTTDKKAVEAVAQARALFARLEEGAASADDVVQARAVAEAAALTAAVDPRHRVVRLWTGRADQSVPDLASLRRFHRQTLGPERHIVVFTRPHP